MLDWMKPHVLFDHVHAWLQRMPLCVLCFSAAVIKLQALLAGVHPSVRLASTAQAGTHGPCAVKNDDNQKMSQANSRIHQQA
jgi:hypothetical protein